MILQSKKSGDLAFKDGDKIKVIKAGGTLTVESEAVAVKLMKMHPGFIIEVDTGNSDNKAKAEAKAAEAKAKAEAKAAEAKAKAEAKAAEAKAKAEAKAGKNATANNK